MFVVLTYDINHKRVGKALKICRKYLAHVQQSVFEGILTEGKLNSLKKELERIIDTNTDAVCIYTTDTMKFISKEQIGLVSDHSHVI